MKVKSSPCCQTLFCLKNTGHLLSSFIIIQIIINIGNNKIIQIPEQIISKVLFRTIDRQSSLECLYSMAIRFDIFSGLYTTSSKKYHSDI
jgi:hypothetical protein